MDSTRVRSQAPVEGVASGGSRTFFFWGGGGEGVYHIPTAGVDVDVDRDGWQSSRSLFQRARRRDIVQRSRWGPGGSEPDGRAGGVE